MAPPVMQTGIEVNWTVPAEITVGAYDTVNIYWSYDESTNYQFLKAVTPLFYSGGVAITSTVDTTHPITTKDSVFYTVIFSHSTTGLASKYYLAYKSLTPREQRMVYQLRDMLSSFIANRLADEELRQYLEYGVKFFNVYSPTTSFNMITLPANMESLVILGAGIYGMLHNFLGIGFTDITCSDSGLSFTTNRMDKMSAVFDKIVKLYNEIIEVTKRDFAETGGVIGTVQLPIGIGGKIGPVLQLFNVISGMGR